jgi:hypothetical protein
MAKDSLGIQGTPRDIERRQQGQLGTLGIGTPRDIERRQQGQLGTSVDTTGFEGVSQIGALAGQGEKEDVFEEPKERSLKTFTQSLNTAFKTFSPIAELAKELGRPVNEGEATVAFNKNKFNIVTSSGAMQGRIVGDNGVYDPANNLFHGMNRTSKFGNLEKAGQKRIDNIEKTIAKKKAKGQDTSVLEKRANDFRGELDEYRRDKNNHNINYAKKKGVDTTKLNPNEMRNVSESGDPGGNKGKIVCTMMNESYGFGSFRNKIWMKFHGNIAPEYQKGYHKLFLPLVNYAKQKGITNKIIKNILEHIAVHSTIDMRQTLRGKRHTLGRLYRKVILPLCYWAGKK